MNRKENKLNINMLYCKCYSLNVQKQPSKGILQKRCSAKMQQIYWRSPMKKCDFNKVA